MLEGVGRAVCLRYSASCEKSCMSRRGSHPGSRGSRGDFPGFEEAQCRELLSRLSTKEEKTTEFIEDFRQNGTGTPNALLTIERRLRYMHVSCLSFAEKKPLCFGLYGLWFKLRGQLRRGKGSNSNVKELWQSRKHEKGSRRSYMEVCRFQSHGLLSLSLIHANISNKVCPKFIWFPTGHCSVFPFRLGPGQRAGVKEERQGICESTGKGSGTAMAASRLGVGPNILLHVFGHNYHFTCHFLPPAPSRIY